MTKSDNPHNGRNVFGQPQQMQNSGQHPPQPQMDPGAYHPAAQQLAPPNPAPVHQPIQQPNLHGQPQAGQPAPYMPPQVAGQLAPPLPGNTYESYSEPAAPQFETPVDDYQYPQGHSVLPDVPVVAVPPSMQPHADQMMPAPLPQVAAALHYGADAGYGDAAAATTTGNQISQRLVQMQNQFDESVSEEIREEQQAINSAVPNSVDPYAAQRPASEEFAGYAPQPHPEAEQYGQPEDPAALHYQEQPQQSFQQPHQGYQDLPAGQLAPPSPMQASQGSYEYAGPTPDNSHQYYGQEEQLYAGGSSIQQEHTGDGGIRKIMFGGAFVAALAVGGVAAYTYQYTDMFGARSAGGPAPTIKATSSPIKIIKDKIAGASASINKAMHNRLGGGDTASGSDSIEKVVDLAVGDTNIVGDKVSAASKGMLSNTADKRPGAPIIMNKPRRVKTLIVRPDGTILRPAGNDVAKPKVKESVANAPTPKAIVPTKTRSGAFNVAGNNKIRRMKTIREASSARILDSKNVTSMKKPVANTPKSQIVKKTVAKKQVKVKKPTVIASVAPTRIVGNIGNPFVVQVTSRSSQTSALAAFADMQQKYPNLIGAYAPDIQRADLGNKGIWYRLRVGPVTSKVAASDLCTSLKQAGHPGCFVRRK
ncbi:MAG: hypothetical protein GY927_20960 [bacterium]|nr:hypothetical protein [bacterium]